MFFVGSTLWLYLQICCTGCFCLLPFLFFKDQESMEFGFFVGLFLGGPTSVFGVSSFSIFAQVLLRKWCLWQLNVICSQCVKIRFLWILVYLSLFVGMTIPGILMWVEWWGLVCWLGPLANFFLELFLVLSVDLFLHVVLVHLSVILSFLC